MALITFADHPAGGDVEGGNELGLLGGAGKLPGLFHEFLEAGYIEIDFPFAAE